MEEKLNSIFKAYDIRGKVGTELNTETAFSIGRAFGEWLPTKGNIAIGRDMRPDSKELAKAFTDGLTASGRDVFDLGQVTSDMIYFAAGYYDLAGGAMITASHNPGDYNGIKFCQEAARPVGTDSGLEDIKKLIINNRWKTPSKSGNVHAKDVGDDWIRHVLQFVDIESLKPLRIVVDAGNGMAGKIFPLIQQHLPFDVTQMYFELDGTFPNHIANPIEAENIHDLIKMVRHKKADVGIAFDGDGDRAVLIDESGVAVSGTILTAMLSDYFLSKFPEETILYNATCGRIVPEVIAGRGGKPIRTKVGHSYIKADMRTHNAIFAGESSGHYYFRDNFMADSGLIAAIVALSIICKSNQTVSALTSKYKKYISIPETNFVVNDKALAITKISNAFSSDEQDLLDGLSVYKAASWFNVRASNTEPLLRLNAEADNNDVLKAVVAKVTEIITSIE